MTKYASLNTELRACNAFNWKGAGKRARDTVLALIGDADGHEAVDAAHQDMNQHSPSNDALKARSTVSAVTGGKLEGDA